MGIEGKVEDQLTCHAGSRTIRRWCSAAGRSHRRRPSLAPRCPQRRVAPCCNLARTLLPLRIRCACAVPVDTGVMVRWECNSNVNLDLWRRWNIETAFICEKSSSIRSYTRNVFEKDRDWSFVQGPSKEWTFEMNKYSNKFGGSSLFILIPRFRRNNKCRSQ